MKHTRVPSDRTQGFGGQLSRHYRYQAFAFFEAESAIRLKVKSKTGKSRMDRADRETETQKTKKSTYLSHAEVFKPGQIDEVQCVRKIRTFLWKKKQMTAEIQFVSYAISSGQTHQLLIRKLCTNINQPYLIWAAVLCHVPPPQNQWYWDPQSRWKKKRWMYYPWWWLVMVVTPKMKFGRPII